MATKRFTRPPAKFSSVDFVQENNRCTRENGPHVRVQFEDDLAERIITDLKDLMTIEDEPVSWDNLSFEQRVVAYWPETDRSYYAIIKDFVAPGSTNHDQVKKTSVTRKHETKVAGRSAKLGGKVTNTTTKVTGTTGSKVALKTQSTAIKSAKKSYENAKKQHALQRAKERFLTRLSSSDLTSSSSPSTSTSTDPSPPSSTNPSPPSSTNPSQPSSTNPSPPSSTNPSPPSSPVPSILANHPQPSLNPPFPAPNPIPSTTNHYQPYPNTYPYPPFPNCPPYPLPYHQPAPTDPTTSSYLSLLTGCSDCSSKEARILELEEQLDRERERADTAEAKLRDVLAEQAASQATQLDRTVKYVIIRNHQESSVTEGYSLLHSLHPVAVKKQWLETTLRRAERKGAAFTVKKLIDGLVEEDHNMTTSFFRKKHSALLLALEAFARERFISHSEWCRIISDKIASLQRSAKRKR